MGQDSELYISDGHANEKGNQLIAAAISKELRLFKRNGSQLVLEIDSPKPTLSCARVSRYRLVAKDGKFEMAPIDIQPGFSASFRIDERNIAVRDGGTVLGLANEELGSGGFRITVDTDRPVEKLDVVAMPRIFEDALRHNAATVAVRGGDSVSYTPLSYIRSSGGGKWKEECSQVKGTDLPVGTKRMEIAVDLLGSAGIKMNTSLNRNAHRVFDIVVFQAE